MLIDVVCAALIVLNTIHRVSLQVDAFLTGYKVTPCDRIVYVSWYRHQIEVVNIF